MAKKILKKRKSRRPSRKKAEQAVETLLLWAGEDPRREGLVDTPARVAAAYEDWFSGYREDPVTFLERTFEDPKEYKKRARRTVSYLPAIIPEQSGEQSFGVIKNISETGFLLASQKAFEAGKELSIATVLGDETITLEGTVARILPPESDDFPIHLAGVNFKEPHSETVERLIGLAEKANTLVI